MKIVYVINSLGAGGAERHLLNLVRDMVLRGYSAWVVVLERKIRGGANSLEQDFIDAGVKVFYLNSYAMGDSGRWISSVRLMKKIRPDIIHSHLPRSDLLASIVKAILPDIKWITTIHDAYAKDKYTGYWIFPILRWNWRRIDYALAVSKHVQEWGIGVLDIPRNKIRVIYHGVSLYEVPDSLQKAIDEPLKIGCLARFEKRKGIETLVEAMVEVKKTFPNAQLMLAGNDPTGYSYVIKALARSLDVENNVKILGFCITPLKFLHDLDVFAFASSSEGFGIVLIEAMSVGCPVVASDIYPINHIVQDGISGLLAEPGNHHLFARALTELLSDADKRLSIGEAGYQRCINEFSLEKSMNRVHDLYIELTSVENYTNNK